MKFEIVVSEAAEREIEDAVNWYNKINPRLEDELYNEIDFCYLFISDNPTIFRFIFKEVRAIILPKFPFTIYYKIVDDYIEILSFFHHKCNPKIWKKRT